jgi:hypothetical protein
MNLMEFRTRMTTLSRPVIVTERGEPIGRYTPIDRRPVKPQVRGDAEPETIL